MAPGQAQAAVKPAAALRPLGALTSYQSTSPPAARAAGSQNGPSSEVNRVQPVAPASSPGRATPQHVRSRSPVQCGALRSLACSPVPKAASIKQANPTPRTRCTDQTRSQITARPTATSFAARPLQQRPVPRGSPGIRPSPVSTRNVCGIGSAASKQPQSCQRFAVSPVGRSKQSAPSLLQRAQRNCAATWGLAATLSLNFSNYHGADSESLFSLTNSSCPGSPCSWTSSQLSDWLLPGPPSPFNQSHAERAQFSVEEATGLPSHVELPEGPRLEVRRDDRAKSALQLLPLPEGPRLSKTSGDEGLLVAAPLLLRSCKASATVPKVVTAKSLLACDAHVEGVRLTEVSRTEGPCLGESSVCAEKMAPTHSAKTLTIEAVEEMFFNEDSCSKKTCRATMLPEQVRCLPGQVDDEGPFFAASARGLDHGRKARHIMRDCFEDLNVHLRALSLVDEGLMSDRAQSGSLWGERQARAQSPKTPRLLCLGDLRGKRAPGVKMVPVAAVDGVSEGEAALRASRLCSQRRAAATQCHDGPFQCLPTPPCHQREQAAFKGLATSTLTSKVLEESKINGNFFDQGDRPCSTSS